MTLVVTEASDVQCAHQGVAALKVAQPKLTVSGKGVLVKGDLLVALLGACLQTKTNAGEVPCTKVDSLTSGEASKLTIRGHGVLLDSFAATTIGKPQNALSCKDPKQARLRAE
jgi:hypothetical protein